MDVGALNVTGRANEGFRLTLLHPGTQEPNNVFIRVLGRDSTDYRRLSQEQQRRRIQKMQKAGRINYSAVSDEDVERDTIQLIAACTKEWGEQTEVDES